MALVVAFPAAENETRQLQDFVAEESHYLTILYIEYYFNYLFCNDSMNFSYLEPYRQRILQFFGNFGFHFFFIL